uniref:Uncharacterized protein n=1 Tax=Geobacter sp. (strain M21) TaxID=443144 RepID=C6E3X8_GEOSM
MGVPMNRHGCAAIVAALLVFSSSGPARGAFYTYYPYQMYEEYHRRYTQPRQPEPQGNGRKGKEGVKQPQPVKQAVKPAPEFLFPERLGVGVAVGVPQDLFYLPDGYYLWRQGSWYRSSSYDGPWGMVRKGEVPAQLVKYDLATMRELRNQEYRRYWEEREKYRGKRFRPARKPSLLPKESPTGKRPN